MNNRVRTGNFLYNTARLYHYSMGVNGGYFNLGMNYTQQSIASGNFGLDGKSISSLGFSAFTPYSATMSGQMIIGASDPWLNLTYESGFRFSGYFGGNGLSISNTWFNSGIGAMRPLLGPPESQTYKPMRFSYAKLNTERYLKKLFEDKKEEIVKEFESITEE